MPRRLSVTRSEDARGGSDVLVPDLWARLAEAYEPWRRAKKDRRKLEEFESSRWQREGVLALRRYDSYAGYRAHQVEKLDRIEKDLRTKEGRRLDRFRQRFRGCEPLASARNVLCLGARLGTEVRVLKELGCFAVGIDLNPGPDNPHVLVGDFHGLTFPDDSVDAVYTIALDHTFDLKALVAEVRRVLRPSGAFVVDAFLGFEEGFIPGEYEASHWATLDGLLAQICQTGGFRLEGTRDLEQEHWKQSVLRAPPAPPLPSVLTGVRSDHGEPNQLFGRR